MSVSAKAHQLILFLLCSSFAVQIFLGFLPMNALIAGGQLLSLLLPLLVYLALTGGRYTERLSLKTFRVRFLFQGIGITLLLQPFLMLLATGVENFTGNPMAAFVESLMLTPVWVTVTGLAIMPALIEEVVFRGILLNGYRRFSIGTAALLNGAVFGMFHMNIYQFSYAFVLGVFFSVVTRRSGSVIPAMVMHFLNNLISVILIYQVNSNWYKGLEALLRAGTTPGAGMLWGALAACLSLGSALWMLRETGREPEGERFEMTPEEHFLPGILHDWPLLAITLAFAVIAVVPFIPAAFK